MSQVSGGGAGRSISLRKAHPTLYWVGTIYAAIDLALGLNFVLLQPTFPIFGAPNELWGAIFLMLGLGNLVALNFVRLVAMVRGLLAFTLAYMMFLGLGTMQPWVEGKGSLQLPIMYFALSILLTPVLFLPLIRPWLARR